MCSAPNTTRSASVSSITRIESNPYSSKPTVAPIASSGSEYGYVKIRYKLPSSSTSRLISTPIARAQEYRSFAAAPQDARFAAAVAGFAELLRGGKYSGTLSYDDVLRIAAASRGKDEFGYRSEFVQLVRAAKSARTLASLGE